MRDAFVHRLSIASEQWFENKKVEFSQKSFAAIYLSEYTILDCIKLCHKFLYHTIYLRIPGMLFSIAETPNDSIKTIIAMTNTEKYEGIGNDNVFM